MDNGRQVTVASILWRRLDAPGHDACRLARTVDGWRLEGRAVFLHEGGPACLAYSVACDHAWRAQRGEVRGWVGSDGVELRLARAEVGGWTLDEAMVPSVGDCADLDFGFTPATNCFQLRRLALSVGQAAEAPAAWLDVPAGSLTLLPQRYERRSETSYWYESPSSGYSAHLEVAPSGFVLQYPGLWEVES